MQRNPDLPTLFHISPLVLHKATQATKDALFEKLSRHEPLAGDDWSVFAIVADEKAGTGNPHAMAGAIASLLPGARIHANPLCEAALGATGLAVFTCKESVSDCLSWLARAHGEGIAGAALPLAKWYTDRVAFRDLSSFRDEKPPEALYDATEAFPRVPFPETEAECMAKACSWALKGIGGGISECEDAFDVLPAADDLLPSLDYALICQIAAAESLPAKRFAALWLFRDGSSAREHEEAIALLRGIVAAGEKAEAENRENRNGGDGEEDGEDTELELARDRFRLACALCDTADERSFSPAEEAFGLFRKAAEGGLPEAMRELSFAYEDGMGTPPDRKLSVKWLCDGAEAGDGTCRLLAGHMLLEAARTPKEKRDAAGWIRLAAEENDVAAAWAFLADLYAKGGILPKSHKRAIQARKRALELGWTPPGKEDV